jgi:hypothetical protein
MVGIPPWWLRDDRNLLVAMADLDTGPAVFASVTALLVLAGLAAVIVTGWRRRRVDVFAAGVIGAALCGAIVAGASSTPVKSFFSVGYTLRWGSPAGMCVWLLLGWSLATVLRGRAAAAPRRARWATIAATGVVAALAAVIAIAENPPPDEPYRPIRAVSGQLDAALPPTGATLVETTTPPDQGRNFLEALRTDVLTAKLEDGIVYWLRRDGRRLVTARYVAERLDDEYARGSYDRAVNLAVDAPPPGPGQKVFALTIPDDKGFTHRVTVTIRETAGAGR